MIKVYKNEQLLNSDQLSCFDSCAWQILIKSEKNFCFTFNNQKLVFIDDELNMHFDIDSMLNYHKVFFYKHSIYEQPLAKALGIKKSKPRPSVIDASAGSLKDSSLIYSFGVADLTIYERNPLIAVLIENALKSSETMMDVNFVFSDSLDLKTDSHSVIYYDPMYEEKNNKSAPRKEMQLFRKHIGPDTDNFDVAMRLKELTSRLVIKRSSKAAPLIQNPSMSFGKKSTVYDVYLNH